MSEQMNTEISEALKELITRITGLENDGSSDFNTVEKYFCEQLKNSSTMYFLNKLEVDRTMGGMVEKFKYHGYFSQALALEEIYDRYITLTSSKPHSNLNIIMLLLCLSERPISNFVDSPQEFYSKNEHKEDDIPWSVYLEEDVEPLIPKFDESFDYSEMSELTSKRNSSSLDEALENNLPLSLSSPSSSTSSSETDPLLMLKANRDELLNTIQERWTENDHFHDMPTSDKKEANIGSIWEYYLADETRGMVDINVIILSEYKVIREILWQFWETHTSVVFDFEGNSLKAKNNVTIPSCRVMSFHSFIENEILPYIKVLDFFKYFSESFIIYDEEAVLELPQTYRTYNKTVQDLIHPVYDRLLEIEDKVREQREIYTLIKLAEDLQTILEPVLLLKKIHDFVITDFWFQENIDCATSLLARLHNCLNNSINKLDLDMRVTIYMETLAHYLTVIDSWFMKDDFVDYSKEFMITKTKNIDVFEDNDYFELVEVHNKEGKNDKFLKIITTKVLQIGKNLYFLRLLGEFSVLEVNKETIYEEFVRRTLEELCKFFDHDPKDVLPDRNDQYLDGSDESDEDIEYKYPLICVADCNKPTEMDKLTHLVDTSNGFLMLAYKDIFKSNTETPGTTQPLTLFEKISKITKTFFPVTNFFENIFNKILKERFTVSGLRVKQIFIEQFLLERYFHLLKYIYLFFDNTIFAFYRRFFSQVCGGQSKNWGNNIWLTCHLQDIIMDLFPEFDEKCCVNVNEDWKHCCDSLEACDMISISVDIQWPVTIIVSERQMLVYKDIFNFILKIKWGLYNLNHLSFKDLEPRGQRGKKLTKTEKDVNMKLKYLRFALINLLNNIHHYIFSFVFPKCIYNFELEFEKANDLSTIMNSHSQFINSLNKLVCEIKHSGERKTAFCNVTRCIKTLKHMWENRDTITPENLYGNYKTYTFSYKAISPIISPVYLFDY